MLRYALRKKNKKNNCPIGTLLKVDQMTVAPKCTSPAWGSFVVEWKQIIIAGSILKNSHQLIAGPLSRRLCPSISRNNEEKMTPTTTMSIIFLNGCGRHFVFN